MTAAADPLVSIVVPSLQQGRFLRTCLDSILSQDYEPIELLVQDGGSTDGSVAILESYGDRLSFRSAADGGQCRAINEGFRRSRGEIVAWLNSDDYYYPGAVRRAVAALRANPAAGVVYGEGDLVDEEGRVRWRFPETVPFDLWRLANVSDYILQPTAFFRREVLIQHGMLDDDLNWGLDWDLWIRLGKHVPFVHLPEVLAASRVYGETKTATGGLRRLRELLAILRRHGVARCSPAGVSHAVSTVVRRLWPTQDLLATEQIVSSMPGSVRGVARPLVRRAERSLRRWMQNAQGIWSDGFAASVGHLWLPSDGRPCSLLVRGRNLDLRDQVVAVRVGGRAVRTHFLEPGEAFELRAPVAAGSSPVKAMLACARTARIAALDDQLGARHAGCVVEEKTLVSA